MVEMIEHMCYTRHRDTTGAFPKRVGVVPKTVQRWDREDRRKRASHGTNQRFCTDEDLAVVLGLAPPVNQKRGVVSGRVFQCCPACGLGVDAWIEASGSGLNVERQQELALVDRISAGAGGVLILAHQDRLARFGFPLELASLCQAPVRPPGAEPAVAEPRTSTQARGAHPAAQFFKPVVRLAERAQHGEGDVGPWQRQRSKPTRSA